MSEAENVSQLIEEWIEESTRHSFNELGRFLRSKGLTRAQFGIMMHLYPDQQCGVSAVGKHMEITNAAVSQLLDRLVEKGLIERTEDPDDRRARNIYLTDKGRDLLKTSIVKRTAWAKDLVNGLTSSEQDAVRQVFPVLIERLKTIPPSDS